MKRWINPEYQIPPNERPIAAIALLYNEVIQIHRKLFVLTRELCEMQEKARETVALFHEQFPQEAKLVAQDLNTYLRMIENQENGNEPEPAA